VENINIVFHKVQYAKLQRKTTNICVHSVWLQNCWQLSYWMYWRRYESV